MDRIIELLDKKYILLTECERLSSSLLDDDIDVVDGFLDDRETVLEKLEQINLKIKAAADETDDPGRVKKILRSECSMDGLTEKECEIYKKGFELSAVISRIERINSDAVNAVKTRQDGILEEIKNMNGEHEANASKFFNATYDVGYRIPGKDMKI